MNVDEATQAAKEYNENFVRQHFPLPSVTYSQRVAITLLAEVERLRAELAAAKKQFINDCIKHINKVALLNDCEFEGGMIADSVQEYFGDKQCL